MQTGRARKCGAFNAAGERPKPLKNNCPIGYTGRKVS